MSITHDSNFKLPTSFSSVPSSAEWGMYLDNGNYNIAKYTVFCLSSASGRDNANTSLGSYFSNTAPYFKASSRPDFNTSSYGYRNFAGFGMEIADNTRGPYVSLSNLGTSWTISFFYTAMTFSAKGSSSNNGTIFSIADQNYMIDIETNRSGNVYLYNTYNDDGSTRSLNYKLEAGIPYAFVISRKSKNLYFRVYDTRNGNGTFYGTAQLNPYSITIRDYFTDLNSFNKAWFGFGCGLINNSTGSYFPNACSSGYFQSIIILKNIKCVDSSDGKPVVWNRPLYWNPDGSDELISTAVIKGQTTPKLGLTSMNLDMTKDKYLRLVFDRLRGGRLLLAKDDSSNAFIIGNSSSKSTFNDMGVLVNYSTAAYMYCIADETSYKINNGRVYDEIFLDNVSYYNSNYDDFKNLNVNGVRVTDVRCNSSSVNAVKCNEIVVYARKATLSFNIATTAKAAYYRLKKIRKPNGDSYSNQYTLIVFNEGTTNSTFTFTALYGETWISTNEKYTLTGDGDFKITVSE